MSIQPDHAAAVPDDTDAEREALAAEAVSVYLSDWDGNPATVSYLAAALRDARTAFDNNAKWLACLGYLITVEQIGHTIARRATAGKSRSGSAAPFDAAIVDFAPDSFWTSKSEMKKVIKALYALRCAFAHDLGLTNNPPEKEDETPTKTTFALTEDGPLVTPAQTKWDGTLAGSRTEEMTTRVNVVKVREFVERMVDIAREAHQQGDVVLVDDVDPEEVLALLTFQITGS